VPGTIPGATVTVYADGVAIGSAVAAGAVTTVITDGVTVLGDGARNITARQALVGEFESADSAGLIVTIDTIAPRVTAFGLASTALDWAHGIVDSSLWTTGRTARTAPGFTIDRFIVDFDENVSAALGDFTVTGTTTGPVVLTGYAGNLSSQITWTAQSYLVMDRYDLVLDDAATDIAGNALDGEPTGGPTGDVFPSGNGVAGGDWLFELPVMPGDADGDGDVDVFELPIPPNDGIDDLSILIANWGSPNPQWGIDADFDGDGDVDVFELPIPPADGMDDLSILIMHWGGVLPPGVPSAGVTDAMRATLRDRLSVTQASSEGNPVMAQMAASTASDGESPSILPRRARRRLLRVEGRRLSRRQGLGDAARVMRRLARRARRGARASAAIDTDVLGEVMPQLFRNSL
jgi:hypothetical protein